MEIDNLRELHEWIEELHVYLQSSIIWNFVPCGTPGARLTKTYNVTIKKYRKSHIKNKISKIHILCVYGFTILYGISKVS